LIVVSATGPTKTIRQKNVGQKNDTSRISFSATSPGSARGSRTQQLAGFPRAMKKGRMAIELSKEAKQNAIESLQKYFEMNMEEPLGNLAASALLGFIIEEIGPCLYNKGVTDAQERMQVRISELDYEVHEDEFQYWRRQQKSRR
jgi:uncharacterized protein (DUF2164 family)